jgi:hypothetical protein
VFDQAAKSVCLCEAGAGLAAGVVVVLALARVANLSEGVLGKYAWMIAPIGPVLVFVVSLARAAWSSKRSA